MSKLQVDTIVNNNDNGAPTFTKGAVVTGVITATSFSGNGSGLTGVGLGTTGSINTSGIITATSFFGSGANLTGVSAGIGTTGSVNTSGIITATSFFGSGANLTGVAGTSVFAAGSAAAPSISPTGDSNTGIFFPAADTIAFAEGGAEAMRVDSSGRLLIGTSSGNANGGPLQLSGGITFPATAVAATDVNTLDDYEEGTWTPVVDGTTTGTASYITQTGSYVKVGRLVHISLNLTWTSGTGAGALKVTNLPFTPGALGALAIAYAENIVFSANNYATANVHTNNNIFILQIPTGGGGLTNVTYDAAGTLIMAGSYSV
jgi:hypothetical protein